MRKLLKTIIPQDFRTFTVTWTEAEDPADFNPIWSDDAAGLSAGSLEFDKFFGCRPVVIDTQSREEVCELKKNDFTKYVNGETADLSGDVNVMVEFPLMGVKMSKNGDDVTLSITRNPNRESDGFQYFAHSLGTLDNPIKKDKLYIGVYKSGYSSEGKLVSKPNQNIYIQEMGGHLNAVPEGFMMKSIYQHFLIAAMYFMKYGTPKCREVIGKGYTGGSGMLPTGGTETVGMCGSTDPNDPLGRVKLFGLEDMWGMSHELIGGYITGSGNLCYVALQGFASSPYPTSNYKELGQGGGGPTQAGLPAHIMGDSQGMFLTASYGILNPRAYDTYYCTRAQYLNNRFGYTGGDKGAGDSANIIRLYMGVNAEATASSRLALLK